MAFLSLNHRQIFPLCLIGVALGMGLVLAVIPMASGQDMEPPSKPRQNLDRLEQKIIEAGKKRHDLLRQNRSIDEETARLRARSIKIAQKAHMLEEEIHQRDSELLTLRESVTRMITNLATKRHQIHTSLGILQRIALRSSMVAYLSTNDASDAAYAASSMRYIIPALKEEMEIVTGKLQALKIAKERIETQQAARTIALETLTRERSQLDSLILEKQGRQTAIDRNRRITDETIAELSARADSLRDLIENLSEESEPQNHDSLRDQITSHLHDPALITLNQLTFSQAKGRLLLPAQGQLAIRYGESIGPTNTSRGITIHTANQARVIAPFSGTVLYTGKFRGYGHLLIISHGEGYHGLLSGLDRIDVKAGQHILAGEPVGIMGKEPENGNNMYFEIRQSGNSINPLPWLAQSAAITSG